ncbi:swi5-dependent recombination DNA repair protein 1 homolog [Triticum dicoccoides]|uniref:swi5-dependent recombination DNA repair protein 1 homolog n=1 Tax=Triticum dicoccoides TaxID=85692 RepID=UPI000E79D384|nr:swi5-dependent recombination DNA repair protein 1 homolog [Triticum dicoccoides]
MADGDQSQQPPRYWFPYWSGPPPPVRPQMSRRLSPPQAPSSPAVPSSPRRPSPSHPRQPTPRAAQSQASSRPSPSPSRASPLAPTRELPNSNSVSNARPPPKPVALPATPKPKDVDVVPQPEKTSVHPPAAAAETKHGHRAAHHNKEKEVDKEKKDEHKSKDKKHHAGEDSKHKDKEKKNHADAGEESKHGKEKDKEKKHHADAVEEGKHKGNEKEAKAEHGKLHGELKAGVADMVRRATGSGHQGASVITLAGENKGASMKVGGGMGKDGSWKEHHGGHRLDGGAADGKPDGQKKQGMMTALINSNVQVINNSLLLHSSCSGSDPGVHLKLSAKSANKDKQKHAAGADKDAAAKK